MYLGALSALVFSFTICSAAGLKNEPSSKLFHHDALSPLIEDSVNQVNTTVHSSSPMQTHITAGNSLAASSVRSVGFQVHLITDTERSTFGIHDHDLKEAVNAYFGKSPKDAYVRSPTPWGDLYKRYDWAEVRTTVKPIRMEILNFHSQPNIVKTSLFENKSSQDGTFDVRVTETVSNTVTSTWSTSTTISMAQSISYDLTFLDSGVGGESTLTFSNEFGESKSSSKTITLGSSSGVRVELNPGESVRATLIANKVTMKIRVTYRATLSGRVAINYNPRYKEHHFHALDVNGVLKAAGKSTEKYVVEELEVDYYSDGSVSLSDRTSRTK